MVRIACCIHFMVAFPFSERILDRLGNTSDLRQHTVYSSSLALYSKPSVQGGNHETSTSTTHSRLILDSQLDIASASCPASKSSGDMFESRLIREQQYRPLQCSQGTSTTRPEGSIYRTRLRQGGPTLISKHSATRTERAEQSDRTETFQYSIIWQGSISLRRH